MKPRYRILIIVLLLMVFFRGAIFRLIVTYEDISKRPISTIENQDFLQRLSEVSTTEDIESLIHVALNITANQLHFRSSAFSTNPNKLFQVKSTATHCVGYSAFFGTVFQQLLLQQNWQNEYEIQHTRGPLRLFGFDLHQISNDPFFQDHDFNIVIEKKSGKRWVVDAAIFDYLGIKEAQ